MEYALPVVSTYAYGIKQENKMLTRLEGKRLFAGIDTVTGSGNQFYAKEDLCGDLILAQVKSTKAAMFSLKPLDFKKLEANALKFDRIPVFIVNFSRQQFAMLFISSEYTESISAYLEKDIPEQILGLAKITTNSSRTFHTINGKLYRGYFLEDFR